MRERRDLRLATFATRAVGLSGAGRRSRRARQPLRPSPPHRARRERLPAGAGAPHPGATRGRRGRVTSASAASVEYGLRASSADLALAVPPPPAQLLDEESRTWLQDLRGRGPRHEAAVERLHALLL